jgi:hypothetical protein
MVGSDSHGDAEDPQQQREQRLQGRSARIEEELYRKALGLLDKCKIEASR